MEKYTNLKESVSLGLKALKKELLGYYGYTISEIIISLKPVYFAWSLRGIEGASPNQSDVEGAKSRFAVTFSLMMIAVVYAPMMAYAQESQSCCEPPDEFDLFLIGDADSGQLTPFSSELEEKKST